MVEITKVPQGFIKTIDIFDGGENNNVDPIRIKDNEFVKILNFNLDEVGALVMRNGATTITASTDSEAGKWIGKWIRNDMNNITLIGVSEKLYRKVLLATTELITGLTSTSLYACESWVNTSDTNFLYFTSSEDAIYRVLEDYSSAVAGCVAPTVAPTLAENGVGTLDGDYYYSYSYLYEWGESNESPASLVISPSSKIVTVTFGAIPATALGVFIYRTIADELDRLQLIYVDTGTSYDDNLSDGVLGSDAPTNNGIPRVSKDLLEYNNYMFFLDNASPDRMYFSKLQYPDNVGTSDYDNPIRDYDNLPTKLSYTSNPSFLIVFYEKSIIAYAGTSPFITETDPMEMFVITENLGCPAPYSVTRSSGDIIFFGNDNRIHILRKVSLAQTETIQELSISENIDGFLQGKSDTYLNKTMISKFSGWFNNGKYYLLVATGTNSYLDTMLVVDFTLPKLPWVHHTTVPSMFGLNIVNDDEEVTALLSNTSPNLYQFGDGLTDNGTQITAEFETKHWDFDHPFNRKIIRNIKILGEATPDYSFSVKVWFVKNAAISSKIFSCSGTASVGSTTSFVSWCSPVTWGQGNWTYNVSWSNVLSNFLEDIPVMGDGEIVWFEVYDISSTYRLKFKKFEIRGFLMRSRP